MPNVTLKGRNMYALLLFIAIIMIIEIHTIPVNSMTWCNLVGQGNAGDGCHDFVLGNINAIFLAEHAIAVTIVLFLIYKTNKKK